MAIQSVCFIVDYKTINETTPAYYWVESSIRSTLSIWSLNNLDAVSNENNEYRLAKLRWMKLSVISWGLTRYNWAEHQHVASVLATLSVAGVTKIINLKIVRYDTRALSIMGRYATLSAPKFKNTNKEEMG